MKEDVRRGRDSMILAQLEPQNWRLVAVVMSECREEICKKSRDRRE